QLGYVLPRAPVLMQDLRNVARTGLASWRQRQPELRDLLTEDTSGGGWVRLHGNFGSRDFGLGNLRVASDNDAISDAKAGLETVLRAKPTLLPTAMQPDLDAAIASL